MRSQANSRIVKVENNLAAANSAKVLPHSGVWRSPPKDDDRHF
ncbi:MAG: hypothetical protein ACRD20_08195 [Terriglobales bacterium]